MVDILGLEVESAAVDSHRREGALRSCCIMTGRAMANRRDERDIVLVQHRAVDAYGIDISKEASIARGCAW